MTSGGGVVADYGHTGLSLRDHPVSFLRDDLTRRKIVSCADATLMRDRHGPKRQALFWCASVPVAPRA
jgi:error-prone DNA polymerase